MNPLESRKKLLIAESELNRAQLAADLSVLGEGVRTFAHGAKSFQRILPLVAMLVAGVAGLARTKPVNPASKVGWLRTLLKSAGFISTLWLAVRPMQGGADEK